MNFLEKPHENTVKINERKTLGNFTILETYTITIKFQVSLTFYFLTSKKDFQLRP